MIMYGPYCEHLWVVIKGGYKCYRCGMETVSEL